MIRNKKAMSDIVTTIIIIGIALAAVGVVWYVYNSVIKTQTTQVMNQSGQVYASCIVAGLNLMDPNIASKDECDGVVSYHGGQMCCSIVPK